MKKNYLSVLLIVLVTALVFMLIATYFKKPVIVTNQPDINFIGDEYVVDSSDYLVAHKELIGLPLEEISPEEKESLLRMREEEKLARDIYTVLYETWGANIFRNIAKSEATHTEAVRYLIKRYSLIDPIKDETVGVFSDDELSKLYAQLVRKGEESLESAFWVGALVEDMDIYDLNNFMTEVDNQDINIVYNNLMRGSTNHLRAFVRQLDKMGKIYSPQYISEDDFQEIIY
jgi:hypothetical protein